MPKIDYSRHCRGKVLDEIYLQDNDNGYTLYIQFEDSTAMTFDIVPGGRIEPELMNFRFGGCKSIRRYRDQRLGS
jgi:hypothetical protein